MPNPEPTPPSPGEIQEALERVLSSEHFSAKQHRSRELLKYLVERAIKGEDAPTSSDLAAAMNSSPDAVRALKGRIRKALEEYYSQEGRNETLQLTIGRHGPGIEISRRSVPISFRIADRIRSLREQKHITVARLAELAGFDRKTIQTIEAGRSSGNIEFLQRIADALEVTIEDLMLEVRPSPDKLVPTPAADFEINFDPAFKPAEVKELLTAIADYYRACGGAGFELDLEGQEAIVTEPVHV